MRGTLAFIAKYLRVELMFHRICVPAVHVTSWIDVACDGLDPRGSTKDRLLRHPTFGWWLFDWRLVLYDWKTLVLKRGRSSISNRQRGLRRCLSFPWTPSSWSKRKSWRHNAYWMLSVGLLLIQRALIIPLPTFLPRSLLPAEVNFASIPKIHPALSGVFLNDQLSKIAVDIALRKFCFPQVVPAICSGWGFRLETLLSCLLGV